MDLGGRAIGRPLRVLQVHNRYRRPGGEDVVVAAERRLLRAAGHEVFELATSNPAGHAAAARTLVQAPWNVGAARSAGDIAARVRPDIAHVHNTWFTLTPSVIAALHEEGVPVVMTLHNYRTICAESTLFRDGAPCERCVGSHPWHGVAHSCYNGSMLASIPASATIAVNRRRGTWSRQVDLFLTPTQFGRDRFVAGGLPVERIEVKPHFVPDPGARLRPPSHSDEVLFVGRLSEEKGVATLIEAANRAGTWRLVVVGDGDLRGELQREAGPRVRFAGLRPAHEVAAMMRDARALAFPSVSYETFGLVLAEAMAAGLPVLASDLGGTADIVGDDAGHLAVPGDVGSWVEGLGLLEDGWVDAAGRAARLRWTERFSPMAGLPALLDAYRRAMTRPTEPDPAG